MRLAFLVIFLFSSFFGYSQIKSFKYLLTLYNSKYSDISNLMDSSYKESDIKYKDQIVYIRDSTNVITIWNDTLNSEKVELLLCRLREDDYKTIKRAIIMMGAERFWPEKFFKYQAFYKYHEVIVSLARLKNKNEFFIGISDTIIEVK